MHRLIKIRLVRDLESLDERLRAVKDTWFGLHEPAAFRPSADFFETSFGMVLRMELAGVSAEDLSLTLAGQELTVRGQRRSRPPEGATRFWRREIACGPFERTFRLPEAFDPDAVQARLTDGVLEVVLPRSRSRRILVTGLEDDQDKR